MSREHEFIKSCDHSYIVKYVAHGTTSKEYFVVIRWIEGCVIEDRIEEFRREFNAQLLRDQFLADAEDIVRSLGRHNIIHRDISQRNIIILERKPYFFDFFWALWANGKNMYTPTNLMQFNDQQAVGLLQQLLVEEAALDSLSR
ncbi:MAG: hypothetical protein COB04_04420 [Gammaproteobacteria bacterium]|nr:MAG: hypothetical protein COB04_04420 [Gammaproteobacteria bacterium]